MSTLSAATMEDSHGRTIRYLRVSVTERCNQNCVYCMPEKRNRHPQSEPLSLSQLLRVARTASELGVTKIRVTGGEPLTRKGVPDFIRELIALPGVSDVSLTTNGILLDRFADELWSAGLRRLNISMDSLKRQRNAQMTGQDSLESVMAGYHRALARGFRPMKINCVVIREFNDNEILHFAEMAARDGVTIRFIEFMPMGGIPWGMEHIVPGTEILERLRPYFQLTPVNPEGPDNPARSLYRIEGTAGHIGLINSITHPFCGSCSRLRLTAYGGLRPCLLNDLEVDLKPYLDSDEALKKAILDVVSQKPLRHLVTQQAQSVRKVMASVGG